VEGNLTVQAEIKSGIINIFIFPLKISFLHYIMGQDFDYRKFIKSYP